MDPEWLTVIAGGVGGAIGVSGSLLAARLHLKGTNRDVRRQAYLTLLGELKAYSLMVSHATLQQASRDELNTLEEDIAKPFVQRIGPGHYRLNLVRLRASVRGRVDAVRERLDSDSPSRTDLYAGASRLWSAHWAVELVAPSAVRDCASRAVIVTTVAALDADRVDEVNAATQAFFLIARADLRGPSWRLARATMLRREGILPWNVEQLDRVTAKKPDR